jgi:7,8-dihydro-6-hydroxymethylpterin-pyrophosphokinase
VAIDVPAGPDPTTGALALLVALKAIEGSFGRRPRGRWGPRELDLDLLVFGRHRIDVDRPPEGSSLDPAAGRTLEVPHPEAHERLFVLDPLADLVPSLVPPGWGETVRRARRRAVTVEGPDATRLIGRWDAATGSWSAAEVARR